jgi:polyhydroxyalkanoate synthesis regulator phasin
VKKIKAWAEAFRLANAGLNDIIELLQNGDINAKEAKILSHEIMKTMNDEIKKHEHDKRELNFEHHNN